MAIVLLILKIIGIALLSLLGVILLVLLILLFAPLRYKVLLNKDEKLKIDAKITWLFSIISVQYKLVDDEDDLRIRIPFFGKDKNEKPQKQKPKKHKTPAEVNVITNNAEDSAENEKIESVSFNEPNHTDDESNHTKNKKISLSKLKEKVSNFFSKAKDIISNIIKYKNLAQEFDLEFGIKRTLSITLKYTKKLLHYIRPKPFEVNATIGLDDPADTGMLIGACCIATEYLPGNIYVEGDFQNSVFKCDVNIKGRSNLLLICIPILQFLFTEPILDIIKKYRRD